MKRKLQKRGKEGAQVSLWEVEDRAIMQKEVNIQKEPPLAQPVIEFHSDRRVLPDYG